jgi:hypothetical protein
VARAIEDEDRMMMLLNELGEEGMEWFLDFEVKRTNYEMLRCKVMRKWRCLKI